MNKFKKYDIIVYGATGFTGQLVCDYLYNHKDIKGLKWGVSGRSEAKLLPLSNKYNIDYFIASSFDFEALNKVTSATKLIISMVGPYDKYGDLLINSCLNNRTHYLDITGEPNFVHRISRTFKQKFKDNNTIAVHCCGMESIPPDICSFLTIKELTKINKNSGSVSLRYLLQTKGMISGGTWGSFVNALSQPSYSQKLGEKKGGDRKKIKYLFYDDTTKKWALYFPVIDKYIINKSFDSYKENANNSLHFEQYLVMPSWLSCIIMLSTVSILFFLSKINIFKYLLLKYKPSGSGPSKEERKTHWFKSKVIGSFTSHESFINVKTVMKGGDPGYGETSKFVSEMALSIIKNYNQLNTKSGILTPIQCAGPLIVDRLIDAGISIKTSTTKEELTYGVSPMIKRVYFVVGFIFLIIGILGYIFPVLPGTVFLILSAFCFLKSSKRFYDFIVNNPRFGAPVKDYVENGRISKIGKFISLSSMWIATIISMTFIYLNPKMSQMLPVIAYLLALFGTRVILSAKS